jgi:hypothetical protein
MRSVNCKGGSNCGFAYATFSDEKCKLRHCMILRLGHTSGSCERVKVEARPINNLRGAGHLQLSGKLRNAASISGFNRDFELISERHARGLDS